MVGGLEKVGVIDDIAKLLMTFTYNKVLALTIMTWFAAFGSAIIDNIPLTATLIPIVGKISLTSGVSAQSMVWAIALGTGLGGNGTPIASSATIVALGIATSRGHPISFKEFSKIVISVLVISTAIANAMLLLRYVLFC